MKIEIWSDFVCPFCYIGKRNLEKALEGFSHHESVTIEYKSYQLDPAARNIPGKNFCETFSELKGIPLGEVKTMNEQVTNQAKTVGLDYRFDTMQYANTFDAHRLFQYAERKGKGAAMTERLLHAYFTESELLSDMDTLVQLAGEVGMDREEVRQVLKTEKYTQKVKEDIAVAGEIGVQGVPFFVFNEKYALSGAQPSEIFAQALAKVWEEEGESPTAKKIKSKTSYCTDEDCVEQ
ncbi:DsbA family oxidoreductase [Oceanobacillus alkalisoli]|uniref:DsbA family oxidoreductase n=1 Tax=Oceanobacillus alkalisoli TaxID=2925113 RepID=UPI001EE458B9|nr:DsbA family oxidoreductase [Oceanobacillus alkalisoli]MCG5104772.1 DsbA family oxidoreductase [Oceanobacillus alkalisoli]